MSLCAVTLLDDHAAQLRQLVLPKHGREGAAYVLFRRVRATDAWESVPLIRYLSREVVPLDSQGILSSSRNHVTTDNDGYVRLLQRAAQTDCAPGFVHGHPSGFDRFSQRDDANEAALTQLAQNRNGEDVHLVSLVFAGDTVPFGRVWTTPDSNTTFDAISTVGQQIRLHARCPDISRAAFHRQELAFGPALTRTLASLRVGVVGCGATGTATVMLLARLGVRRLLLIDNDTVETTNLNRLLAASASDVGEPKIDVTRAMVERMDLGVAVQTYKGWVGDAAVRDRLKSCDVLFGCTDDHDGRALLNRFAYFYLVPVFDMGIRINVAPDRAAVTHADARVTVLIPGARCLLCHGVVNPVQAREDDLLRRDPEEYARRRAEGEAYIRGGGVPNPAVVTFTTGVACMAVDEFVHRLTNYRHSGPIDHRVSKYHLSDERRPGADSGPCPICLDSEYWGLGDTEPFLDRVG
ncbi:MAG: ThiF family adenylyltransferase [Acidobacteria bacterium]|nr:ThiF family adenylyltransferase [Acidobacteriota bacterium]MYJ04577.1 ThiF family adenylyltransferase [Acidobacteriota bacterium]